MGLPKLEFWFEYGGVCAFVDSSGIGYDELPVSESLMKELCKLCDDYDNQINWSDPHDESVYWTKEQEIDFYDRAMAVFPKLQSELEGKYIVVNCLGDPRQGFTN